MPEEKKYSPNKVDIVDLLGQCILDEIQIRPDLLREALEWIARRDRGPSSLVRLLFKGRHGNLFHEIVKRAYMSSNKDLLSLGSSLADITLEQIGCPEKIDFSSRLVDSKIFELLNNEDPIRRVAGSLAIMDLAFYYSQPGDLTISAEEKGRFKAFGDSLIPILYSSDLHLYFAACWAFAWLGETQAWTPEHKQEVLFRLLSLWKESDNPEVQYVAAWAFSALPLLATNLRPLPEPDYEMIEFIKKHSSRDKGLRGNKAKRKAALVAGYYFGVPWTDEELTNLVAANYDPVNKSWSVFFLKALGEPGIKRLEELKRKEPSTVKPKGKRVFRRPAKKG